MIKMKRYFAHSICAGISISTLAYAAMTPDLNLLIVVFACAAILLNYRLLIPNNFTALRPLKRAKAKSH